MSGRKNISYTLLKPAMECIFEKTIEQTTEQWTLALKTIELRDTSVVSAFLQLTVFVIVVPF